MSSNTRLHLTSALFVFPTLVVLVIWGSSSEVPHAAEPDGKGPVDNGPCYVCHLSLQKEEITSIHLSENTGCADCHGVSDAHMHDEMLMTTPDVLFGRAEVDGMCGKCHADPHEDKRAEVKAFLEQWRGRDRPNGRAVTEKSICTDCHGTHNIAKEMGSKSDEKPAEWIPAFNGQSLAGWRSSGAAQWKAKLGRIIGTPGPNGEGGILWGEVEYQDFLLSVTFRADWPIHAAIWLRANDAQRGPRIEIFESRKPPAFTGSVRSEGKSLVLINPHEDLFDAEGWNTISADVRGNRVQIWLNGEEVGAVRVSGPAKGQIGLHLEGGPTYRTAELAIREILIQPLPEEISQE